MAFSADAPNDAAHAAEKEGHIMNIKETAQKYSDYIIETRRYLHMHPELSTKCLTYSVVLRPAYWPP